jgi:hypothetical protein
LTHSKATNIWSSKTRLVFLHLCLCTFQTSFKNLVWKYHSYTHYSLFYFMSIFVNWKNWS